MRPITVQELWASLGRLEHLLREEGELIVTRNGEAVVRVLPIEERRVRPDHKDLRDRNARFDVTSQVLVGEERDER